MPRTLPPTGLAVRIADLPLEFAFMFRRWWSWSPRSLKRTVASGDRAILALGEPGRVRHAELAARYDLERWIGVCTASEYRESLYVLDLCDRFLADQIVRGRRLDVGSKNGAYLPGLCAAFADPVDGVELDAHRRYANGATRRGHALGMLRRYPLSRFLPVSVTEISSSYAVITWFLPFIIPEPFEAWELPRRFFEPERLLEHVVSLLAPGGVLLVVNQEVEEAEVQGQMFARMGLRAESLGEMTSAVNPYGVRRFGWRFTRSDC